MCQAHVEEEEGGEAIFNRRVYIVSDRRGEERGRMKRCLQASVYIVFLYCVLCNTVYCDGMVHIKE